MKRLNVLLTVLALAPVVVLAASQVSGQYATPLRYDLRYSNPMYIPSGVLRQNPARYDPYAFGSVNYGDLSLTGNVRGGKSFQGNVPYTRSGSEVSANLPSLRLSNFRRDSVGVEDLGTGVEYGAMAPYVPGSGSVTSSWDPGSRFAVPLPGDRAPYGPRNVNAGSLNFPPAGSPAYAAADRWVGGYAAADAAPARASGLTIPQSALDFVRALMADAETPDATGTATPPDDKTLQPSVQRADERLLPKPAGILGLVPPRDEPSEKPSDPRDLSALFWLERSSGTTRPEESAGAAVTVPGMPALGRTFPPPSDSLWEEGEEETDEMPVGPAPYIVPVSTYAVYVQRAHGAMQEPAYERAEALYAAAAALESDRPAAFFGRIHALMGQRMYLQAIVVLERELTRRPEWIKVIPDLKAVYAQDSVYDRILADLRRELENKPFDAGHNFLMGYVYYAGGDLRRAKDHLLTAAKARGEKKGPEEALLAAIQDRAKN